jgi:hypothetical protein
MTEHMAEETAHLMASEKQKTTKDKGKERPGSQYSLEGHTPVT